MPSEQSTRDLIANMKLIAIPELIRGKRIVICDDSIVRGTQLRKMIKEKLLAHGAKEVHLRIACPPLYVSRQYNHSRAPRENSRTQGHPNSGEGRHPGCRSRWIKNCVEYRKIVETVARTDVLMYQRLEASVGDRPPSNPVYLMERSPSRSYRLSGVAGRCPQHALCTPTGVPALKGRPTSHRPCPRPLSFRPGYLSKNETPVSESSVGRGAAR